MAGSAWTNQVVNQLIVAGSNGGVFVYVGAPGPGNPPIEWVSSGLVDPYGNALPTGGIASWNGVTGVVAVSGNLNFFTATANASFSAVASPGTGAAAALTNGDLWVKTNLYVSGPVSAIQPGTASTPETWHAASLGNGWSGTAQYKLLGDGMVALRTLGSLGAGTLTNGTVLFTLPAAWQPATAGQAIPCVISAVGAGTAATGNDPYLLIGTDGTVAVFNIAVQVATNIRFSGSYSLLS